jgi:hypothetical protein
MRTALALALLVSACGSSTVGAPDDAGHDAGTLVDSGGDAGHDGGQDADLDAGYDAGQDAATDSGTDAGQDAASRFTASIGGSVADASTGLTWVKDAGGSYTQSGAVTYCSGLSFDGATNWRLPTLTELASVSGAMGFPATVSGGTFWTTSTGPAPSTFWYVTFASGAESASGGANTFGARCVR